MNKLFFDIETLPAPQEKKAILKEYHESKIKDGKKEKDFEEFLEETSFDGAFGRIACIGYAVNDEPAKVLSGDEKPILIKFWEIAKSVNIFIGFNVFDFDLRFVYQRSIILGVKPSVNLSFARYRNYPVYDVMYEWSKWNNQYKPSLNKLAKAFGFPSSKGGEVEGKNVAKAYEDGRIKEICEYCMKDVELTRKIYKRMVFEDQK
jgi:predicted PolB exonuclease-like 3'-5' exonuclease